jgi:hypothetical protein
MTKIMVVIVSVLAAATLFASNYNREHPGYSGGDNGPDATTAQVSTPKPKPVFHDSDAVKGREEAWVQDHMSLIAHVDPGNDKSLTVTMDGDTWDSWSAQDKELHERGIYSQWVNAYAQFHAKKWPNAAPFSLRIVDLTGTKIAEYY